MATKSDIHTVREDVVRVARRRDGFDVKLDKLQWMEGIIIALTLANFAKQYVYLVSVARKERSGCRVDVPHHPINPHAPIKPRQRQQRPSNQNTVRLPGLTLPSASLPFVRMMG